MNLRILSVAESELDEAVAHYEDAEIGLGRRFLAEVRHTMARIVANPNAWHNLPGNFKRCRTKAFPYGVIYQLRHDEILVVAVASFRRKPDYWRDRV